MPRINRHCYTCGTGYYYCPNCEKAHQAGNETWHIMFHDENCRKIFDILQRHFTQEYTNEVAKEKLLECDLSNMESFKPKVLQHCKNILESQSEAQDEKPNKSKRTRSRKSVKTAEDEIVNATEEIAVTDDESPNV